jgi:hypothetical protein
MNRQMQAYAGPWGGEMDPVGPTTEGLSGKRREREEEVTYSVLGCFVILEQDMGARELVVAFEYMPNLLYHSKAVHQAASTRSLSTTLPSFNHTTKLNR